MYPIMPLKAPLFQIAVVLTALLVAAAECTKVTLRETDDNPLLTQSYHLGENGRGRVELVPDRKEYRDRMKHELGL